MFNPIKNISLPSNTTDLLVKAGIGVGLFYVGRSIYRDWKKSQGEDEINTPEGQIAQQLKNIFNSFPVDDAAYRRVMQLVNPGNDNKVRDIYKLLTGRFLSDDEAAHIEESTQETQAKQYKINSTPGSLISIVNDKIRFNVGPGSLVRFAPGQTTGIQLYLNPEDIATGASPVAVMPPNSKYWKVSQVRLVPIEGLAMRKDWKILFAPIIPLFAAVRTRKEYAAVQIDLSAGQGKTFAWANATDFRMPKSLGGVQNDRPLLEVIAATQATVLNERFAPVGNAPKGVILGDLVMTLNTGTKYFSQIRTVQGLIRWVETEKVVMKEK